MTRPFFASQHAAPLDAQDRSKEARFLAERLNVAARYAAWEAASEAFAVEQLREHLDEERPLDGDPRSQARK